MFDLSNKITYQILSFNLYSRHVVNNPDPITITEPTIIIKSMLSEKIVTPIIDPNTNWRYENGCTTEASATCNVLTIIKCEVALRRHIIKSHK